MECQFSIKEQNTHVLRLEVIELQLSEYFWCQRNVNVYQDITPKTWLKGIFLFGKPLDLCYYMGQYIRPSKRIKEDKVRWDVYSIIDEQTYNEKLKFGM